eukprot:3501534-Amphidinium_carterae.1
MWPKLELKIVIAIQGEYTDQILQFSVLPPSQDRKRRNRRKASSTPPSDELAHNLLVEALTPSKVFVVCPTEINRHPKEPHVLVAHAGGTNSATPTQHVFDPERAKHRKRPYPLGPAFDNVMIFPAPDLGGFIDTTTFYMVQSGRRFDFEQKVKNAFGDKAAFMESHQ